MKDLCFDVFGLSKEKVDPKTVKGNRGKLYCPFSALKLKGIHFLETRGS